MKKLIPLLALAIVCCGAGTASASLPTVNAKAWVVENGDGEVLGSSNLNGHRAIASITKLMTVLVVLDHHKLNDIVTVDSRAAGVGQETINIWAGERLSVADLIRGALIQSANDAACALALATAPSLPAFATLMNAKAASLGLRNTHFVRPDGLDADGAYSSAADVTTLARDAMTVPFIRNTVDMTVATIAGGRTLHTWNDLLGVLPGVIGVKTGHTDEAGWSQVVADDEGGTTIYATILGSPTRAQRNADLQRLISWGLGHSLSLVVAVSSDQSYAQVNLPYGHAPLELVAASSLSMLVRPGETLTQRIVAPRAVQLPVRRGQRLGSIQIWLGERMLGQRALLASRSVKRPDAAERTAWFARRTVHHIAGLFK